MNCFSKSELNSKRVRVLKCTTPSAVATSVTYPYPSGFNKDNMGIIGWQVGWSNGSILSYYTTNNSQCHIHILDEGIVVYLEAGQSACVNMPLRIFYVDISE